MASAPEQLARAEMQLVVMSDGSVSVRVLIVNLQKGGGPIAKALDQASGLGMEKLRDELAHMIDQQKLQEMGDEIIQRRPETGKAA